MDLENTELISSSLIHKNWDHLEAPFPIRSIHACIIYLGPAQKISEWNGPIKALKLCEGVQ